MSSLERGISRYDSAGLLHLRHKGEIRSLCGKHMVGLAWEPIKGGKLPRSKPAQVCCRCWRSVELLEGRK